MRVRGWNFVESKKNVKKKTEYGYCSKFVNNRLPNAPPNFIAEVVKNTIARLFFAYFGGQSAWILEFEVPSVGVSESL